MGLFVASAWQFIAFVYDDKFMQAFAFINGISATLILSVTLLVFYIQGRNAVGELKQKLIQEEIIIRFAKEMGVEYIFVNTTTGEANSMWVFGKYQSSIIDLNEFSAEEINECFEKVVKANEWLVSDVVCAQPNDGSKPLIYEPPCLKPDY